MAGRSIQTAHVMTSRRDGSEDTTMRPAETSKTARQGDATATSKDALSGR